MDAVLRTVAQRPPGTRLIFTYVIEAAVLGALRKSIRHPEPWHFGIDSAQLQAFLAVRGLALDQDFGAAEHQADYLRPAGRKLQVSEIERVAIASV